MNIHHKFLYISFFFPPLGGAEARYNISVIRRLYAKGFLPTIVTAPSDYPYSRDEYLESLVPSGITIINTRYPHKYMDYFNAARRIMKVPENPLAFRDWKSLYEAANAASTKEKFDFIYSVHGIGSAHLAALKLKEKTKLPWIAEFRDPWLHNVIAWDYMRDNSFEWWCSYQFKRTRRILKAIIDSADLLVVESPLHKERLVEEFAIEESKVQALGMGYEEDYFSDIKQIPITAKKRPIIGFVGSVYYGYEYTVKNLIQSLKQLEDEGVSFTLVSVGDSSKEFLTYAEEAGLVSFLPISRVDYSTALGLMSSMDFGIVLVSKDYEENINSKLWEYLRLNLHVIAIVPEQGAMAKIINENHCGYVLPYEAEPMQAMLRSAIEDYNCGRAPRADNNLIKNLSRESMVDRLISNIESILSEKA